ncbi:MAG TPA: hypothetical protein VJH75_02480 [Patescibacteria group bacterium]|nr:hypothetical protein [Patescibacteria group bacterium]
MNKTKKILSFLGVFALVLGTTVWAVATNAGASDRPEVMLFASDTRLDYDEKVTLTAVAATQIGGAVDSMTININGQNYECSSGFVCQHTVGPFSVSSDRWMNYSVTARKGTLTTVKTNRLFVETQSDNTKPYVEVNATTEAINNDNLYRATVKAYATDNSGHLSRMTIYVREEGRSWYVGQKNCDNLSSPANCELVLTLVPGRTYKYWAKAADPSGNTTLTAQNTLRVAGDTTAPSVRVGADKDAVAFNEKITFTANTNEVVKKINILVNARVVKNCYNTNACTFTGGPYPSYAGTSVSYGANAYDYAGNRAWTGYKSVRINPRPVVDNVNPIFSRIVTSNHSLDLGDKFDLKIYTSDNRGIKKIDVILDGQVVHTCVGVKECGTTVGPFSSLSQVGEHKYEFLVEDTSGNTIRPWGKFTVYNR